MTCPQAYEPPAFSKNACPWRDGSAKAGNCERTKSRSRRGSAITEHPDGRRLLLRLARIRRLAMCGFRLAAAPLPLGDSLSRGDLRERHANQELSIHGVTPTGGVDLPVPMYRFREQPCRTNAQPPSTQGHGPEWPEYRGKAAAVRRRLPLPLNNRDDDCQKDGPAAPQHRSRSLTTRRSAAPTNARILTRRSCAGLLQPFVSQLRGRERQLRQPGRRRACATATFPAPGDQEADDLPTTSVLTN